MVTGASSGIGAAIAQELARAGCGVILVGRDSERLEHVRASLRKDNRHLSFPCDFSMERDLQCLIERLYSLPTLNILVHAAGAIHVGDVSTNKLDEMLSTNLRAPIILTEALLTKLTSSKGAIAFINSSAAITPSKANGIYAASKAGLKAYTDSLRQNVNNEGVRVLSIFPGKTATPMQERLSPSNPNLHDRNMIKPAAIARALLSALMLDPSAEVTDIHVRPMRKE